MRPLNGHAPGGLRRCISLLVLGCLTALLCACGGGDDAPADAPVLQKGEGADAARAKAAAFGLSDFPQGRREVGDQHRALAADDDRVRLQTDGS
jgi:hypothetical protein